MITYTIESVKESVKQVGGRNLLRFIDLVINLVKSHGLGVDKRITGVVSNKKKQKQKQKTEQQVVGWLYLRHVNVNIRFTSIQRAVVRHREVGPINQGRNGISALRDPRSVGFVVEINI